MCIQNNLEWVIGDGVAILNPNVQRLVTAILVVAQCNAQENLMIHLASVAAMAAPT